MNFFGPKGLFSNFGVPISRGSLSQLPRWVFLGQYYPLKVPRCIKTPRVFETIKLFCTDDRLQLIITFLESIRIHQNQNKMVKWTSRYCPILKLLETVEDFAFHKHNYHSVRRAFFIVLQPSIFFRRVVFLSNLLSWVMPHQMWDSKTI